MLVVMLESYCLCLLSSSCLKSILTKSNLGGQVYSWAISPQVGMIRCIFHPSQINQQLFIENRRNQKSADDHIQSNPANLQSASNEPAVVDQKIANSSIQISFPSSLIQERVPTIRQSSSVLYQQPWVG